MNLRKIFLENIDKSIKFIIISVWFSDICRLFFFWDFLKSFYDDSVLIFCVKFLLVKFSYLYKSMKIIMVIIFENFCLFFCG